MKARRIARSRSADDTLRGIEGSSEVAAANESVALRRQCHRPSIDHFIGGVFSSFNQWVGDTRADFPSAVLCGVACERACVHMHWVRVMAAGRHRIFGERTAEDGKAAKGRRRRPRLQK